MGPTHEQDIHRNDDGSISPPSRFAEQANVSDPSIYERFEQEWPECWAQAAERLEWEHDYDTVVDQIDEPPYHRWFVNGRLNAATNCIDRHARAVDDRIALEWIGEREETESYTYAQLKKEVTALAAGLRSLGIEEDDRIVLYLPHIPELVISMLACARLGAVHVVVFADYGSDILASIYHDTSAEALITCDGHAKEKEVYDLYSKIRTDADLLDGTTIVTNRVGEENSLESGWRYSTLVADHWGETVAPVARNASDPLFICYTSAPKSERTGMIHNTGGYLSYVTWTSHAVLDLEPGDTLWCPAGIEWITGHSYEVYGALACGATTVLYQGTPAGTDRSKPWNIIEEYDVTQFYTTPTMLRTCMERGREKPRSYDLSSLRLLGTVGQRIDADTWLWFYDYVGEERCPIVDTWYQAETGGMTLSTLPGICDMKPGAVGPPLPGIDATVVDADGDPVAPDDAGYLVFERPWPGMYRSLGNGPEAKTYWSEFGTPGEEWVYFAEDGAVADENGYITILGRLDDIINVGLPSKNRIHASEIERTIAEVEGVADVAVVAGKHEIKGEAPYAFVVVAEETTVDMIRERILDRVEAKLSPMACPEDIYIVSELPRTYSGSVLRHVLRDLVDDEPLGNTDLLYNPDVLDRIAVEVHR